MHRSLSSGNKIINRRVAENNYDGHLLRLQRIKSSVSQTSLLQKEKDDLIKESLVLRNNNRKKEVQKEFYYNKVERENKILLDRISNIVYTKASKTGEHTQSFRIKSLNEVVKKKEITKIMSQNMEIVHRIQHQTSMYNVKQWEKDFMKKTEYARNMSDFKVFKITNPKGTKSPRRSTASSGGPMRRSSSVSDFKQRAERFSSNNLEETSPVEGITKKSKTGKRLVLFKKILKIESHVYSIEFSIYNKKLQVNLVNNKSSEPFIISLEEDLTNKLLDEYNNNYNEIITKIGFREGRAFLNWTPREPEIKENYKIELFDNTLGHDIHLNSPVKEEISVNEASSIAPQQQDLQELPENQQQGQGQEQQLEEIVNKSGAVDNTIQEKVEISQVGEQNSENKG